MSISLINQLKTETKTVRTRKSSFTETESQSVLSQAFVKMETFCSIKSGYRNWRTPEDPRRQSHYLICAQHFYIVTYRGHRCLQLGTCIGKPPCSFSIYNIFIYVYIADTEGSMASEHAQIIAFTGVVRGGYTAFHFTPKKGKTRLSDMCIGFSALLL